MKKQEITYTFYDPNPQDVLRKALIVVAADLAVKTVESIMKERLASDTVVCGE